MTNFAIVLKVPALSPRVRVAIIGVLVLVLALAGFPADAKDASVAVTSVNGQPIVNGRVSGDVKGSTLTVTGTADTLPDLLVDAGDSEAVALGQPITFDGTANFGTQPYTFTWSLDGASDRFAPSDRPTTTLDTKDLSAGEHTATLSVTDDRGRTGSDTVKFVTYETERTLLEQSQHVTVGVPEELIDAPNVDGEDYSYAVDVPPGLSDLKLVLSWQHVYADALVASVDDFDLRVSDPSHKYDDDAQAATASMPEVFQVTDPEPGQWTATVHSFAAVDDTFTLTVTGKAKPPTVVPTVSTPGPFTFAEGAPQQLSASVEGGNEPTLRWDLDFDGTFETPDPAPVTSFPLGSHFVTVKATTADGFEKRQTTAVRVVEPTSASLVSPVVVVGVADTGINLYHQDFSAARYPDPRILDLTQNFTRDPAEYLPGYPKGTPKLPISLGTPFAPGKNHPAQDDALFARENLPLKKLFWVPGTKVVGAIDMSDTGPVNGAADETPVLDEDGHGTHSASVAVGNVYGFCPTCLLVFAEGLDASFLYAQPWIDLVSNSYGSQSNIGAPGLMEPDFPKASAERGQIALYAAGNGNENAFVTPEQTYTSPNTGPPWSVRVGAVDRNTRDPFLGTGKPVEVSSFGLGDIPAADHQSLDGLASHSGTSAATPYTAGAIGTVLTKVREVLGDGAAGQRLNGAPRGALAVGKPVPGSPYLSDGVLTRTELLEAVEKSADHDATPYSPDELLEAIPPTVPPNPYQYVLEGYGIVDALGLDRPDTTDRKAIDVLLGKAPLPARPDEDAFFARDTALRTQLWGSWAGGGDNSAATASSTTKLRVSKLRGVTPTAVASIGGALAVLQQAYGPLPSSVLREAAASARAGGGTTLFLHQSKACTGRSLSTGNAVGDGESCSPIGTWTASALRTTVPVGTKVAGMLYVKGSGADALDLTATLVSGATRIGASRVRLGLDTVSSRLLGAADGYIGVPVSFTTTAPASVGAPLHLVIDGRAPNGTVLGAEGGRASFLQIETAASSPAASSGPGLTATVSSPTAGQVVDPRTTPVLRAAGTSNLPLTTGPVTTLRHYPRRSGGDAGCAADTFLDTADKTDEQCGAVNQVVPENYSDSFPLRAELPFTLGEGVPASGIVYMTGLFSPSPVEIIRVELTTGTGEAREVIASQEVQGSTITNPTFLLTGGPLPDYVEFPFSLDIPAAYTNRPLSSLAVDLTVVASEGATGWQLDDPSSFIDLPVPGRASPTTGSRVEVGIDDPQLATHALADLGEDGSWAADLETVRLRDGKHTLYVRVADGTRASVVSTPFEIRWSNQPDLGRVEVQVVKAGRFPTASAWRAATDTSAHHDLSQWLYSGSIRTLSRGDYDLYVRAVRGTTVIATAPKVTFRRR